MATSATIPHLRLHNQQITGTTLETPADLVGWLGAVQAQDYLMALWAVGLRTPGATESSVEGALADGSIVRTWPMRGTLHFVAATDARWMLELLTPRVVAGHAAQIRNRFELTDATVGQSADLIGDALSGGNRLTRGAIYELLENAGISTEGQRGNHIIWRLAHQRTICFGPREGKQQTFVLFDEWIPDAGSLERDEALARIAARYFSSHGPATLQDFTWWSGLTVADARAGIEMAGEHICSKEIDGRSYWLARDASPPESRSPRVDLLPAFDEYTVAYRDRSAVLTPECAKQTISINGIFHPIIVIDGKVIGTWKRTLKKGSVVITPNPFRDLTKAERNSLGDAADRYGTFLALPAILQ